MADCGAIAFHNSIPLDRGNDALDPRDLFSHALRDMFDGDASMKTGDSECRTGEKLRMFWHWKEPGRLLNEP
jgi:hypothetical protein